MRLHRNDLKIFDSAVAHHAASRLLHAKFSAFGPVDSDLQNSESKQAALKPWKENLHLSVEVLIGFAAELYLKGFIQIYGAPQKRIYGLYELFTALPEKVQDKLQEYSDDLELGELIEQHLKKVADSFAGVRYIHEGFPGNDVLSPKILEVFHKHLLESVGGRSAERFTLEGTVEE